MADKLMCIPNDDKLNYHFSRLKIVIAKLLSQQIIKCNYNALGTGTNKYQRKIK